MKILMTTDTIGGVWNYALELSEALVRYGVGVTLAAMGEPLSNHQRSEADAVGVQVYEAHCKLEWMSNPWEDLRQVGQWLLDLHRLVRADLVHLNEYAHGALPWSAPTLLVGHSCVLSWWRAVQGKDAPDHWKRYREAVSWGLRSTDCVVAPSHAMLKALHDCYGWMPHTRVIYNGRCADRFVVGVKEPMILTAGRIWDKAKNLAMVEKVAPRLAWPVYAAGDRQCPHTDSCGFEHSNAVRLLGTLNGQELAHWMGKTSIYVLPARYEPFGLTALEAGLCGCALVLGDIPSLREIWRDHAVFVDPDDPRALEHALRQLIDDPGHRERMAMRARSRALEFTAQRMAWQYLDAYHRLIYRHRTSLAPSQTMRSHLQRNKTMSRQISTFVS
jgi:glycogen synthase